MKKLNNKGFTLVELLAVIVILIAITTIAIPTISSALDRTKDKQDEQRQKILTSAAELFVSEHKNTISATCISLTVLRDQGYVDDEALKDSNGEYFIGYIAIDKENGKYTYEKGTNANCYEGDNNGQGEGN